MSAKIIPMFSSPPFSAPPCAAIFKFPKSAIFRPLGRRTQPRDPRSQYEIQCERLLELVNKRGADVGAPPMAMGDLDKIIKGSLP